MNDNHAFALHLVRDIAVPELARGYSALVQKLRSNAELARLVREKGLDAALDAADLPALKKGNRELVTVAEKEAEALMTKAVQASRPTHAVVGEEHGYTPGSDTRWVFDPVDGTSAMIRTAMAEAFGMKPPQPAPSFGITVAVVEGDEATLGVVAELRAQGGTLAIAHLWAGGKNLAATLNGNPVKLPAAHALADATLTCTAPPVMFNNAEKWSGFQALADACTSCVCDQNCVGFMRILHGDYDIGYEADLAYHDAAALIPILQSAGVTVSDGNGNKLRFPESAITSEFSVLAAQAPLHAQALARIKAGVAPEANRFTASVLHQGYVQKFPAT